MKLIEMWDGKFRGLAHEGSRPVQIQRRGKGKIGDVVFAFSRLYVAVRKSKKAKLTVYTQLDVNQAETEY